jgi:hypothetical protein
LLLHDNAFPHTANKTNETRNFKWEVVVEWIIYNNPVLCNVFLILQVMNVAVMHRTELLKLFLVLVRNGFDYPYMSTFELIKCTMPSVWKVPVWSVLFFTVCMHEKGQMLAYHTLPYNLFCCASEKTFLQNCYG